MHTRVNIYLYLCLITYITREREMKLGGDRVWEKKDKKKEGGMFHSFIFSIKALEVHCGLGWERVVEAGRSV